MDRHSHRLWKRVEALLAGDTLSELRPEGRDKKGDPPRSFKSATESGDSTLAALKAFDPSLGRITHFSPESGADIKVDGFWFGVENANRPWSIAKTGPDTLRFEVRPGDVWQHDPDWKERSEIGGKALYTSGKHIIVSYSMMIEPGEPNTATGAVGTGNWLTLGQFHSADDYSSSIFAIELIHERMAVRVGYRLPGEDYVAKYVYIDDADMARGEYYNIKVRVHFHNDDRGELQLWRNGIKIVDYEGPIGYGFGSYWKMGIYRREADTRIAVYYKNLQIDGEIGATIFGTDGDDIISRNHHPRGQPRLTKQGDVIHGGGGNDLIYARSGDDVVAGGNGHDRLFGGRGDDTLICGRGNDRLTGNIGYDTFRVGAYRRDDAGNRHGQDVIVDFDPSRDMIAFDPRAFRDFDDVRAAMHRSGDDVVIRMGLNSVLVKNVSPHDLGEEHFLFV